MSRYAQRARVVSTFELPKSAQRALSRHCDLVVLPPSSADLLQRFPPGPVRGLLCLLTDLIDGALLEQLPDLSFISSVSVGVDHIDVPAASAMGIAVGNTPGVLVDATADTAFALLLSAARRVTEGDRYMRAGRWQNQGWSPDFFLGKDVSGATLGVVGLGPIGQAMARRAQGFEMEVISWTPSGREVPGVEAVSFEDLLARSDFVSVHIARSETTRHLIDAQAIAAMRPGAVLINTARGDIVDDYALDAALREGHLFAAGLDVYAREPLPSDSVLLRNERLVLTPHIGSATYATREAMLARAIENAIAALQSQPMPYCVNPQAQPH